MGFEGLLDIYKEAAQLAREERERIPVACPNDGTPLEEAPDGTLHCKHDGWTYP